MERKFYPENFERFLKGHADQFKMTPSKKVWHGIYNDLHPGRRWPSIAMSLIFIFTLVIIGHLNTNNGNNTLRDLASLHKANLTKTGKNTSARIKPVKTSEPKNIIIVTNSTETISDNNDPAVTVTEQLKDIKHIEPILPAQTSMPGTPETRSGNILENISPNKNEITLPDQVVNNVDKASNVDKTSFRDKVVPENITEITSGKEVSTNTISSETQEKALPDIETTINENGIDQLVQANTAHFSKPRKLPSTSWTFYVTPSLGYRILSDQQVNKAVSHKQMMGYEGGIAVGIKLYKKLQFTTGLQFNYAGYNIRATNTHPTIASLILNGEAYGQPEVYSTISHYGNRPGSEYTNLKNFSLQASLPIGLQYTLAGNEKTKFNLAFSIQPTYMLSNKGYFLSEDKKNYLLNRDLFRKWNTNSHIGAYISFSSNVFNWQIGPQIRYQFLSTYTNQYQLKENLINYGIRIGISNLSK